MRFRAPLWSAMTMAATAGGAVVSYGACSAGGGTDGQGAAPAGTGSGVGTGGGLVGGYSSGGGTPDDAGCGYAQYPTEREPGVLLLVFDQSCSMNECPDGSTTNCDPCSTPSKWELARDAMQTVLTNLPDELRMGLILYPGDGQGCTVPSTPLVAPGPLATTRQPILTEFTITPNGGGTPTLQGLQAGYQTLEQVTDTGNKAVLLVTDGAWNCFNTNEAIFAAAETAYTQQGFATFVVGILEPSAYLSHLAHVGGTDRVAGCNPDFATLQQPFLDTCEDDPDTCCNYTVGLNVTAELEAALEQIASTMLESCVFEVPKGEDPSQFDPNEVNVVVDGEVVPPSDTDGWSWSGGGTDYIEIHGPLCDALLSGEKDQVEILLGCPTIPPA